MSQKLHPDSETVIPDTDYFFLGNGRIQVAIQWSRSERHTPLGLLIFDPEHFSRKWSTYLFHPEYGLEKTKSIIELGKERYSASSNVDVAWDANSDEACVVAKWQAGEAEVTERFYVDETDPVLNREIEIRETNSPVIIELALYASPVYYSKFSNSSNALQAKGLLQLELQSESDAITSERMMRVEAGAARIYKFKYVLGPTAKSKKANNIIAKPLMRTSIIPKNEAPEIINRIAEQFQRSQYGLRAAVAASGRFDASIWQYNFEWSGDAAMVCQALVYSGMFEVAASVLENILTNLSNDEGQCAESGRFRGGSASELNNNGEVLIACGLYLEWTADEVLIGQHYSRIAAIANYLLRPEYYDPDTNLLKAERDIWERGKLFGVLPGYDVSHQTFAIEGLRSAAKMAAIFQDQDAQHKWSEAADAIESSFLRHPTHSLIETERVIKRRLLDGRVQRGVSITATKETSEFLSRFSNRAIAPNETIEADWEPDVSTVHPVLLGIVDPHSAIAKNTLNDLEQLWSQSWDGGGYGRYNVLAEPDSPGPWPFATAFMASAYFEAGDTKNALRAVEWLLTKAGAGGSWLEFYGERSTPPLPPTGIIVWAWAEYITLVVKHILGARVEKEQLLITPRLEGFKGKLRLRDSSVPI